MPDKYLIQKYRLRYLSYGWLINLKHSRHVFKEKIVLVQFVLVFIRKQFKKIVFKLFNLCLINKVYDKIWKTFFVHCLSFCDPVGTRHI